MKILLLGGYGVFGGRLAELIADMAECDVLIAGRNQGKAESKCATLTGAAVFSPLALDRADISEALETHKPDIVIDASGPFQDYGDTPYFVIEACIAAGVNYMDFADAADFVFGVTQFDAAAKAAGLVVLSGVSSFPVLTAAVLRKFQETMTVTDLSGGIAPSPYAGIGLNVMRAVVGYAGGDVKLKRDGHDHIAKGLTESRRYTIAPPGYLPLRNLHFSLVDVPDLQVIPEQNPQIENIWMGAGPVPESLHKVLNVLAKMRAVLKLPSFSALSPLFYKVLNMMKFGEHRGGMYIQAIGHDADGVAARASWHLLAEGDDGPYIPSMAVEALLRRWNQGQRPQPGARAATQALEVEDYERLFATREIHTGFRNDTPQDAPMFEAVLGERFDELPDALQVFHGQTDDHTWSGHAHVIAARNPLAKLVSYCVGLRVKSGDWPVTVTVKHQGNTEVWHRQFGPHSFKSTFRNGKGRNAHMVTETFGPVTISLALVIEADRLRFLPRRAAFCGVPLPQFLLPKEESFETEMDGKFHFNVNVKVPFVGHIAGYQGWLVKEG